MGLTARQNAFAVAVVRNGGDKVAAYREAGYSTNMKPEVISVKADEVYNNGNVSVKIAELQKEADKIAKEKFSITIEQRLRWLEEITLSGLGSYEDGNGQKRKENLAAARAAIATMNEMLGTDDGDGNNAQPLEIRFTVSVPKAKIETTNVDRD